MFFCPYYLRLLFCYYVYICPSVLMSLLSKVILFLDEPSGIAESYVFNLSVLLFLLSKINLSLTSSALASSYSSANPIAPTPVYTMVT